MTINEAIRQTKPFEYASDKAMVNLMYTHNWMLSRLKSHLKPFNITMQQYNVLRILNGAQKTISTAQIRERLLDKMADTSRLVDRMEAKGWVDKVSNKIDKRLVDVSITTSGKELLDSINQNQTKLRDMIAPLTDEEFENLSSLLDKLRK